MNREKINDWKKSLDKYLTNPPDDVSLDSILEQAYKTYCEEIADDLKDINSIAEELYKKRYAELKIHQQDQVWVIYIKRKTNNEAN